MRAWGGGAQDNLPAPRTPRERGWPGQAGHGAAVGTARVKQFYTRHSSAVSWKDKSAGEHIREGRARPSCSLRRWGDKVNVRGQFIRAGACTVQRQRPEDGLGASSMSWQSPVGTGHSSWGGLATEPGHGATAGGGCCWVPGEQGCRSLFPSEPPCTGTGLQPRAGHGRGHSRSLTGAAAWAPQQCSKCQLHTKVTAPPARRCKTCCGTCLPPAHPPPPLL